MILIVVSSGVIRLSHEHTFTNFAVITDRLERRIDFDRTQRDMDRLHRDVDLFARECRQAIAEMKLAYREARECEVVFVPRMRRASHGSVRRTRGEQRIVRRSISPGASEISEVPRDESLPVIDTRRCMAANEDEPQSIFGANRCQKTATHTTVMGRRCARHAEELRCAMRNPATVMNVLAGGRARTEKEIERLVMEIPKGDA